MATMSPGPLVCHVSRSSCLSAVSPGPPVCLPCLQVLLATVFSGPSGYHAVSLWWPCHCSGGYFVIFFTIAAMLPCSPSYHISSSWLQCLLVLMVNMSPSSSDFCVRLFFWLLCLGYHQARNQPATPQYQALLKCHYYEHGGYHEHETPDLVMHLLLKASLRLSVVFLIFSSKLNIHTNTLENILTSFFSITLYLFSVIWHALYTCMNCNQI